MGGKQITKGKILHDMETGIRYRVVTVRKGETVLCEMDTTKLKLTTMPYEDARQSATDGKIVIEKDKAPAFNIEDLSDNTREAYEKKRRMMDEVDKAFGPTYLALMDVKHDHHSEKIIKDIIERYDIIRSTFWRTCTKYLQSGMRDASLVHGQALAHSRPSTYNYTKKPGPKTSQNAGIIITDEDRRHMDAGMQYFIQHGKKSSHKAYVWMTTEFYSYKDILEDSQGPSVFPRSERPTLRQFEYYLKEHLDE